ncbi:LysR family transcriptional regulator [Sphingobium lactosutens]|uniref:HTH lysR-type domain-containing protein n=1 Tax=Sphingobium lactosutens DS20 TaxID=1331060 RepID=T0IJB7_9SPHN|nr:LysR substrate-binding domain-containing protein [Sphingobium lactosutens]EQB11810.1 hypothetical protein RLDS_22030 [Sphingobium lactosutens DS20]
MVTRIDPGQLLTFLAIYEAGGFNRASSTLHKSQPALTRTVHRLEDMSQTKVFTRNVNGVELTTDGKMLLAHARVIRASLKEAERGLARLMEGRPVQIIIGTAPVHPLNIFANAVSDLMAERPEMDVRLLSQSESGLLSSLRDGDINFAVLPMPGPQQVAEFHIQPVFENRVAIFCRPDHPLAQNENPTIDDLSSAGWILGPSGSVLRDRLEALFASEGRQPPDIVLEVEDQRIRRMLLVESPYLSVFARHNVVELVQSKQLVEIPFSFAQAPRPVVALALKENEHMENFVRHLRRHYEKSMFP